MMSPGVVLALGLALCVVQAQGAAPNCSPKCSVNGACSQSEDGITFCKCKPGFWGETCTAKYTECKKGLVCYNGGNCVPDPTKPDQEMCACAKNWAGATCKVPHVTCGNSTLACMNGGECVLDETVSEWFCLCPPNLRGRQCQLGVQECKDGMFCMNNGVCDAAGTGCECPGTFFGIHCQNNERDPFAAKIPRKIPGWAVGLVVLACLIAVLGIAIIAFLVVRERRGRPVFKSYVDGAQGLSGTL